MKKIISVFALSIVLLFSITMPVMALPESVGAPTITTADNYGGGILVRWDVVDGATGYVVYRRAMKTGETAWTAFARWNNTTDLSFLDTKVYQGTKYQYGVKAYYGTDPSTTSKLGPVGPMSTALIFNKKPAAPSMTITNNSDKGIEITWDAVKGAAGYVIYRRAWSTTTGGWTTFERWNNTTSTTWTDAKVYAGSRYQYGIKAYYGNDPKAMAYVGTVGPLSTNVRIGTRRIISFTSNGNTITINWDVSGLVSGYQLQYSQNEDFREAVTKNIDGKTSDNRSINVGKSGTEYWARVRGFKTIEGVTYYGSWSSSRSVKTGKNGTASQNEAAKEAKLYLEFLPLSFDGLIMQLEYDDFSHQDAVFAAEYCGADWYYNAVQCAIDYINVSAFSESGLISQLEYEQFTPEQALYGVVYCNADWYDQAVRMGKEYLDMSSYNREQLIDQLVFEGFTYEQAKYGADKNGL